MTKHFNLDSITSDFVDSITVEGAKPLYELTVVEARRFLVDLQRQSHIDIDADVIDTFIPTKSSGDVDIRFVRPKGTQEKVLPLIIYLHGGGWILGDKETHDILIRKLAICTNSVVAFVNYSRSPEAIYPSAIEEIYGVLEYLYSHYTDFNIDKDKIIIAGDSAGGNMAAVIAIKSKKENGPKIKFQLLLYPVTDTSMDTESYKLFKDGPWLSKKAMEWFWNAYVPQKSEREDIYVSPLKAEIADLENLPPALVVVAENDVLRDEGELYAAKLNDAGVDTTCVRINGTHHDFLMLNALQASQSGEAAFMLICSILNSKLKR